MVEAQESNLHLFATKNSIIRNLMRKFLTSVCTLLRGRMGQCVLDCLKSILKVWTLVQSVLCKATLFDGTTLELAQKVLLSVVTD